jgi:hypothetical protein
MMKYLVLTFWGFTLWGCGTKAKKETHVTLQFAEMKIDSLALESIFSDSSLTKISSLEASSLSEFLTDTSGYFELLNSLRRLDSLKSAGKYENYISNLDIGMYKDITGILLKDISVSEAKTLRVWGINYSSYEACPYFGGKVLFISTIENNKTIACVPFAYIKTSADAPFYENFSTSSTLKPNGKVLINEAQEAGGVDEKDKEYIEKRNTKIEYSVF